MIGLVLTGGGARAAYQVGALAALAELTREPTPFRVLTGVSAGAINSTTLAAYADDFVTGVTRLHETWTSLTPEKVYRTDPIALAMTGARWLRQLTGGARHGASMNALLDTSPLASLLQARVPIGRIRAHVSSGVLTALAVTATSYRTGTAITFFEGAEGIEPWVRTGRIGTRAAITVDHVRASAAIPIFFPPVAIEGTDFGDGCVRLTAPLSPAIHLGADRLVAIGIRYMRSGFDTLTINQPSGEERARLADIGGVLLNAVFLDSLDADVERVDRINATLSLMSEEQHARHPQRLRQVPLLVLRPSRDLGRMASQQLGELPLTLRHLLKGVGASGERGWDLVSYLAFDPIYVKSLIELGYEDTRARRAEVEAFLSGDRDGR